jgi:beta-glucosidase
VTHPATDRPAFLDPELPLDRRVDALLALLTRDERVAMLHQYAPAVPRLGVAAFRTGTEALHGVGWLGPATVFPQAVGLGATWDPELVREVAEAIGVELRAFHHRSPEVSLNAWAPVVNLLRDPRWGRNEEGYSEDPRHTARLAEAFCRGLAGDHPRFLRAAAVLKHFLAYNNEDGRCETSSSVRPRVLHEYDLAAFRPAIASGAAHGVMAAYNSVNGRPAHVTPLLEEELRRWAEPTGHEPIVCSDAEAPSNLVDTQGYFADHAVSHAAALRAGVDSFTDHADDPKTTISRFTEALERGLVTEEDVDRAVRRVLALRFRLGEFDPDLDPYAGIGWEVVDRPEHRALALRAAVAQVTLLKNDAGTLPLGPVAGRRIAVVGPLAASLYEDWYSGTLPYRITPADGLRAAVEAAGGTVTVAEGVDRVALRSAGTGGCLAVPDDAEGPLTADGPCGPEGCDACAFDLFDWGEGVLTLRNARTGKYLHLCDADATLTADQVQPNGWDVHETFRLEPAPDGGEVLRNVHNGRYATVDPATGLVVCTAGSPREAESFTRVPLRDGAVRALAAVREADTAIVVLGNDPLINGRETQDRTGIALPPRQEELLRAVAGSCPNTVLVLMSSYPYAVDWAAEHLPALVWTSHAGQETGRALARVLLGDEEPGGRLPQTWYGGGEPLPDPLDYDIITAGWTYQYHRGTPLFPFGHGLTYTDYAYGTPLLSADRIDTDGAVTVTVPVANTGGRAGTETVQVYTRALTDRYEAPRLRLLDFRRIALAPGESARVTFELPARELAHWDVTRHAFTTDPGDYEVLAGRSSGPAALTAPARLTVTGTAPTSRPCAGRRLAAADYDGHHGSVLVDYLPDGGDAVTPAGAGPAWLRFHAADLGHGPGAVSAEVSLADDCPARVELRADDPLTGPLLAAVPVPTTGDRYAWTVATAAVDPRIAGVRDLYAVLHGPLRLTAVTLERDRG